MGGGVDVDLNVDVFDVVFGEDVMVYITLRGLDDVNLSCNVSLNVDNVEYQVEVIDGVACFNILNLNPNIYRANVYYGGSEVYNPQSDFCIFHVKSIPCLEIFADNINYGEKLTVFVNTNSTATGNVTVIINNKEYVICLVDGEGNITVDDILDAGVYNVFANYSGDVNYAGVINDSVLFNVSKIVFDFNVNVDNISVGLKPTIIISTDKNTTASFNITINNITKEIFLNNSNMCVVEWPSNFSTVGFYNVAVIYCGDENHNNNIVNTFFEVFKGSSNITISFNSNIIDYGDDIIVSVKINGGVKGNVCEFS